MNHTTPEYGVSFLKQFSDEVTVWDYRDSSVEENPLRHKGITTLIWDGRYNISLKYIEDGIIFKIEDDYYKYLNTQIQVENLTLTHFDYFKNYIQVLKSHTTLCSELSREFRNTLPTEWLRIEKLNQII